MVNNSQSFDKYMLFVGGIGVVVFFVNLIKFAARNDLFTAILSALSLICYSFLLATTLQRMRR